MQSELQAIDDALVRLRRLWSPSQQSTVDDEGRRIEMSSLLVVEACARGGAPVSVGDVAAFAGVAHSTASRLVDRAERAGLVRRDRSPVDTRRTTVELTADGTAVRERAVLFRLRWLDAVVGGWSEAEVAALAGLLGRFADSVAVHGDPGTAAGARP